MRGRHALRAGHVATQDAPLVARVRSAGAPSCWASPTLPSCSWLGKPTTFSMAAPTVRGILIANAGWLERRRSRGNRCGMSAGGVGSDGGGSIRVPAHFSGICGLKPTPGRIPATGHFPESGGPFALIGVVGPMARTVADLKALFEVMQGPDDGDTCAPPGARCAGQANDDVKKMRIGYFEDDGRTPVTRKRAPPSEPLQTPCTNAGFEVEPFRPDGLERGPTTLVEVFRHAGRDAARPDDSGHERNSALS